MELSYRKITVNFNPGHFADPDIPLFTFSGDLNDLKEIHIPQGIGMIVVELTTEPIGDIAALFQTYAIQWFQADDPKAPDLSPHMFMVQRIGDNMITIIDFNSAPVTMSHRFNVVVVYDGLSYGTDPVIVNEPPMG